MPEGDTVYQAARRLDRALGEKVLAEADLRVPRLATVDLRGARHAGTVSRGKHLLTRLDLPEDGARAHWTLHTHLRMEGVWHVYRAGEHWRRPAHQARVVLRAAGADDGDALSAVGFNLGLVELLPRSAEREAVGHLGPDLLGEWDPQEAVRRLAGDPTRRIWAALLDQRNLAGIGNEYACELCFVLGIHPRTPVGALGDLRRVADLAHRMLMANRDRAVRSTTGDLRRGRERWVYRRDKRACLRCGTPIRVTMEAEEVAERGERATYWCPHCQPLAAGT